MVQAGETRRQHGRMENFAQLLDGRRPRGRSIAPPTGGPAPQWSQRENAARLLCPRRFRGEFPSRFHHSLSTISHGGVRSGTRRL